MVMTISEAADAKQVSRNAIWLAIGREQLTARRTSGGIWLIEEDDLWRGYRPREHKIRRPVNGQSEERVS